MRDPDDVFAALVERVPWRAERREMYDAVVDVPRLVHTYLADEPLPHPLDGADAHLQRRGDPLVDPRRPALGLSIADHLRV